MNINEKESKVNESANKLHVEQYENYFKEYSNEKTQSRVLLKPISLVYPEIQEKPTLISCLNHR